MKKILSFVAAFAMVAAMGITAYAANNPAMELEVTSTGLKAGDTVTVNVKYTGYNDIVAYDEGTGSGAKLTGYQARIDVPGGIGIPTAGEQFNRAGSSATTPLNGSFEPNIDMTNNVVAGVGYGASTPMKAGDTLFTVTLVLNKDVTEDLVFTLSEDYMCKVIYDTFEWWENTDTIGESDAENITTRSSATLKAPAVEPPVVTDPYTLSAAVAGNDVDGQKTYYTTVTVNEAKSGAKFQVAANGTTKSWALPAICGSGSFVAIVGTNNETGTFANSIIDGTGVVSNVVEYTAN